MQVQGTCICFGILHLLLDYYNGICGIYQNLGCSQIKLPLNLKGLNNIQNEKTHINKTTKERCTVQCAKKYWIWTILEENQKSYTWGECNTLSLPNYKADCGTLHCKFSLSCLDNVYQDLWQLNESLRRKLSKNARDKLWLRVFLKKKLQFRLIYMHSNWNWWLLT